MHLNIDSQLNKIQLYLYSATVQKRLLKELDVVS